MNKILMLIGILILTPVITYLQAAAIVEGSLEEHCSICLEILKTNSAVNPLHEMTLCSHIFHAKCLIPWLKKESSCPLCRADLGEDFVAACEAGNATTVDNYLEAKFEVNITNADGYTPLETAAWKGKLDIINKLLKIEDQKNYSPNWKKINRSCALQFAAQENHTLAVQLLLTMGADPNERDEFNATPLMWAASYGNKKMIIALLEAEASINASDKYKWTSLMYATHAGQIRAINLLLKHGASLQKQDSDGYTACQIARLIKRRRTEQFLQQRGAY